ncbi:hypothetical protein BJ508DRAFT_377227 [Ascobolus immersus RN42]|uniref:HNH nuclease domain-containing protein n=1 Tax=Ascobolus immersus RN42 TaxID=1160509 RepID=A0A3N4I219_ASCIM|nr:hypothetical protein BJ508DRAFT_377227 [Ascobolus immersus RN42]
MSNSDKLPGADKVSETVAEPEKASSIVASNDKPTPSDDKEPAPSDDKRPTAIRTKREIVEEVLRVTGTGGRSKKPTPNQYAEYHLLLLSPAKHFLGHREWFRSCMQLAPHDNAICGCTTPAMLETFYHDWIYGRLKNFPALPEDSLELPNLDNEITKNTPQAAASSAPTKKRTTMSKLKAFVDDPRGAIRSAASTGSMKKLAARTNPPVIPERLASLNRFVRRLVPGQPLNWNDFESSDQLACFISCKYNCPYKPRPYGIATWPLEEVPEVPARASQELPLLRDWCKDLRGHFNALQQRFEEESDLVTLLLADNTRFEAHISVFGTGSSRNALGQMQQSFKETIRSYYNTGCGPPEAPGSMLRCQISGIIAPSEYITAAHLHPVQDSALFSLINKDISLLWSAENGLTLLTDLEKAYDRFEYFIDYDKDAYDGEGGYVLRLLFRTEAHKNEPIFTKLRCILGPDKKVLKDAAGQMVLKTEAQLIEEGVQFPPEAKLKFDSCWGELDGLQIFPASVVNTPSADIIQFRGFQASRHAMHKEHEWKCTVPQLEKFPECTIPDQRLKTLHRYCNIVPIHRLLPIKEQNLHMLAESDSCQFALMSEEEKEHWKKKHPTRYYQMAQLVNRSNARLLWAAGKEDLIEEYTLKIEFQEVQMGDSKSDVESVSEDAELKAKMGVISSPETKRKARDSGGNVLLSPSEAYAEVAAKAKRLYDSVYQKHEKMVELHNYLVVGKDWMTSQQMMRARHAQANKVEPFLDMRAKISNDLEDEEHKLLQKLIAEGETVDPGQTLEFMDYQQKTIDTIAAIKTLLEEINKVHGEYER